MKQSLDDLRVHAMGCTNAKGHVIRWVAAHHGESGSTQQGHCTQCDAWVQINTDAMGVVIDKIAGPAVALDCPVIAQEA